jgi:UPF0148 protein
MFMSEHVRRMADLLKSGASMLSEPCPACGSPLFEVKGKVYCVKCNRPVVIVRSVEEEERVKSEFVLSRLESTVLARLSEAAEAMESEGVGDRLEKMGDSILVWLEVLDKIRKLKAGL